MTLDDTDDVDNLILGKDSSNSDLFLKLADSRAVLLHQSQMLLDDLLLSQIISPLAGIGKSILLWLRPVLVKSPLSLLANMLGPDSLQDSGHKILKILKIFTFLNAF